MTGNCFHCTAYRLLVPESNFYPMNIKGFVNDLVCAGKYLIRTFDLFISGIIIIYSTADDS
ncbi:hypothetical protein DSECCO2_440190 [anaerobic digester metagenome]